MNTLVDVVMFGIVGAVMVAALMGLLAVAAARSAGTPLKAACTVLAGVVLLAAPALAARSTGAGFGPAFLVALGVVLIVYAANVALVPVITRRAAAGHTSAVPRPTVPMLAAGVLVCAAVALLATGLGTVVA